jgi:hypothetical protein
MTPWLFLIKASVPATVFFELYNSDNLKPSLKVVTFVALKIVKRKNMFPNVLWYFKVYGPGITIILEFMYIYQLRVLKNHGDNF